MKFIFTKEKVWLDKWDLFVSNHPKGSHLIFSDWLQSYKSYGFDFEVGLVLDNELIVGGCGVVIPKFLFFKFYIIPHGPIFENDYMAYFNSYFLKIRRRAKLLKCCYVQCSLPISDNPLISAQTYKSDQIILNNSNFKSGKLFSSVYCSYGLNWLELKEINDENELLGKLKNHAKRNIKSAYKNNFQLSEANTEVSIKEAYKLVELNAQMAGYGVRKYEDIKKSLCTLINNGSGLFLVAHMDNQIKGSAFFIKNKYSLTYLFGGTLKEKPDLRVGYFLHWEGVKRALDTNTLGYNISMGGSKGVLRFKTQFNAVQLFYKSPHCYYILNKPIFHIFIFFEKYLKNNKRYFSNLLSKFNS